MGATRGLSYVALGAYWMRPKSPSRVRHTAARAHHTLAEQFHRLRAAAAAQGSIKRFAVLEASFRANSCSENWDTTLQDLAPVATRVQIIALLFVRQGVPYRCAPGAELYSERSLLTPAQVDQNY